MSTVVYSPRPKGLNRANRLIRGRKGYRLIHVLLGFVVVARNSVGCLLSPVRRRVESERDLKLDLSRGDGIMITVFESPAK